MKKILATVALSASLATPFVVPTTASAQALTAAQVQAACATNPAGCAAIVRQAIAAVKAGVVTNAAGAITNVAEINAGIGEIIAAVVEVYEASQAQSGGLSQEILDDLADAVEVVTEEDSSFVSNPGADGEVPNFIAELIEDIEEIVEDIEQGEDVPDEVISTVESGSTA